MFAGATRVGLVGASLFFAILLLLKFRQLGVSVGFWEAAYYYGVPAALALAALCAAFLRPAVRTLVFTHALAIGVGAVSADLYLALTAQSPREMQRERYVAKWLESGIPHDPRSILDVVRDMRQENIPAYPELNPITLLEAADANHVRSVIRVDGREMLPLATMSKAVSVICNETGRYLIYRSDERGFHNPANAWDQPTVDVAVVGDSFAQGDCVPSSKNSVALIREKLPTTLNLGIGGNGPLLELATLTEYLTHIRPRLVLWFYYEGNDLLDLEIERRSPLLMRYLGDGFSQNLMAKQQALNEALRDYFDRGIAEDDLARHSASFTITDVLFLRNLRNRLADAFGNEMRPSFDDRARFELLGEVLAAAKRRTEAWSGRLVFVYLPTRWISRPESIQAEQARSRAKVLATARGLEIPVIDVSADFHGHPDPASLFVFPEMGHYTERGYRFVADRVLGRLSAMALGGDRPTVEPARPARPG